MKNNLIDRYNRKILLELQYDGRVSYTELGKKVGLTGPAVKERVQKLEEAGVIKGYRVKLDLSKIGYTMTAIINFKMNPGSIRKFIEQLATIPEVIEVNRITGGDNMIIKVALKETRHLEKLINRFIEYGVPTTSIVLSTPIEDKVIDPAV
ncbi:MAG TPA: Lrp/AsnC family transcriptional regulator [Bacteroidales bacterium]|nr:Lrp/AsnC family transcriptional regulator [Bacteroidales bacterium]